MIAVEQHGRGTGWVFVGGLALGAILGALALVGWFFAQLSGIG